jgi:hypothetical protein
VTHSRNSVRANAGQEVKTARSMTQPVALMTRSGRSDGIACIESATSACRLLEDHEASSSFEDATRFARRLAQRPPRSRFVSRLFAKNRNTALTRGLRFSSTCVTTAAS